jgi:uncharacterized protein (TIGR03663 family)
MKQFGLRLSFILLIGFLLRVWDLDIKPPHFDEGINGNFVAALWKDGFYKYDPSNFHGPLYFYFLQLAEVLFGKSIWSYRFMNAFISTGIIAVVGLHRRFIGNAALWAAFFIAVSPAFVFYSRYAIHESLFVFCTALFSYGYFLWRDEKSRTAAILMSTGFFGSFATKETFFIFFGTWAIAIGCVNLSLKFWPREDKLVAAPAPKSESAYQDLISSFMIGALLTVALFSGFFMNLPGIGDMFKALAVWSKTGSGATGHEKPMMYWLELMWRYERPLLLGLILAPIAFFKLGRTGRLLVLVGVGHWLAYTLIPYKTPWLDINFLWLFAIILGFMMEGPRPADGVGAASTGGGFAGKFRGLVWGVAFAAFCHTAYTTWRLNFRDYALGTEPYVYVQSTMDFKNVMSKMEDHLKHRPEDLNAKLFILNKDTWPMPWTLVDYPNLNWGTPEGADFSNGADIITVDESTREVAEKKIKGKYFKLPFQIRESYEQGWAYFSYDKYEDVRPPNPVVFEGTGAPPPAPPTPSLATPPAAASAAASAPEGEKK